MSAQIQPATHFCFSFQLMQGVSFVASYTVIVGALDVLSLLMGTRDDLADLPLMTAIAETMQTLVNAIGLVAGCTGFLGIVCRDPQRIRKLLLFLVTKQLVGAANAMIHFYEACEKPPRMTLNKMTEKTLEQTCSIRRLACISEFIPTASLFLYFIYIVWSMIIRMEAGEYDHGAHGALLADTELADVDDLFLAAVPGSSAMAQSQQRPASSIFRPPTPFSGIPRTLSDQVECRNVDHFSGTAMRLE